MCNRAAVLWNVSNSFTAEQKKDDLTCIIISLIFTSVIERYKMCDQKTLLANETISLFSEWISQYRRLNTETYQQLIQSMHIEDRSLNRLSNTLLKLILFQFVTICDQRFCWVSHINVIKNVSNESFIRKVKCSSTAVKLFFNHY